MTMRAGQEVCSFRPEDEPTTFVQPAEQPAHRAAGGARGYGGTRCRDGKRRHRF